MDPFVRWGAFAAWGAAGPEAACAGWAKETLSSKGALSLKLTSALDGSLGGVKERGHEERHRVKEKQACIVTSALLLVTRSS